MFEVGQHVRVRKDDDGFFVGSEGVIENIVDKLIGVRFYMFKDEMLNIKAPIPKILNIINISILTLILQL